MALFLRLKSRQFPDYQAIHKIEQEMFREENNEKNNDGKSYEEQEN